MKSCTSDHGVQIPDGRDALSSSSRTLGQRRGPAPWTWRASGPGPASGGCPQQVTGQRSSSRQNPRPGRQSRRPAPLRRSGRGHPGRPHGCSRIRACPLGRPERDRGPDPPGQGGLRAGSGPGRTPDRVFRAEPAREPQQLSEPRRRRTRVTGRDHRRTVAPVRLEHLDETPSAGRGRRWPFREREHSEAAEPCQNPDRLDRPRPCGHSLFIDICLQFRRLW